MHRTAQNHWPNYMIEGIGLCILMVILGCMATLLYAPTSPIANALGNNFWRGLLLGLSLGGTMVAIIYSPWGKRSGAHLNPAITLTYWRLNQLAAMDAIAYILAQCIGATLGIWLVATVVGLPFTQDLQSLATVPQHWGWFGALIAELLGAFVLMLSILLASNTTHLAQTTGWLVGGLTLLFGTFIMPLSGWGLNPARSLASGLSANVWDGFWLYYLGPSLAMLVAAEVYLQITKVRSRSICCKLCPNRDEPCLSLSCCQQSRTVKHP